MRNKVKNLITITLIIIMTSLTGCSPKQGVIAEDNAEKIVVDESVSEEFDGVIVDTEKISIEDNNFLYYDCPSTECEAFIKKGLYFCPMCLNYFILKSDKYVYKNSKDSDEWKNQKFWDTQIESFLNYCNVDLSNVEEVKEFIYDNGANGHGKYKDDLREAMLNDMVLRE